MNKIEVSAVIALIATEYPKDIDILDSQNIDRKRDLWYSALKDYDKNLVHNAVKMCLTSNHFCPKLADIMQAIEQMNETIEESVEELWDKFNLAVQSAARLTNYFQFTIRDDDGITQGEKAKIECKKIYDELPNLIKKYCASYDGFMNYAFFNEIDEKMQFEKGRFIKSIPQIKQREKLKLELPEEVKDKLIHKKSEDLITFNYKDLKEI